MSFANTQTADGIAVEADLNELPGCLCPKIRIETSLDDTEEDWSVRWCAARQRSAQRPVRASDTLHLITVGYGRHSSSVMMISAPSASWILIVTSGERSEAIVQMRLKRRPFIRHLTEFSQVEDLIASAIGKNGRFHDMR